MPEREHLTASFHEQRAHLRAIARRLLGSASDAEDAVQEAWLRVRDQDPAAIENVQAWLTTVVARVCLNMLRSRRARREHPGDHVPDGIATLGAPSSPEQDAILADSVGVALLVVLDTLAPAERLAFVLHDVFGIPFSEIAELLDRSEAAAQQLASRARRRVGRSAEPERDPARPRQIVDAFFAASRDGDFDALVRLLHPDVELRIDGGKLRRDASLVLRGAKDVASHTRTYASLYPYVVPAIVNGMPGAVIAPKGRPFAVMSFTICDDRIARIDALLECRRLARHALVRGVETSPR